MAKLSFVRLALRPNVLLSILGVCAGVIGSVVAGRLIQARALAAESALNDRYRPDLVVVASRDLQPGQLLEKNMLALRAMPRDFLPSGALNLTQAGRVIGGRLAIGLRRGDLVQAAFVDSGDSRMLSSLVGDGRRALTISVDDTNSMGGLLGPGDVVDLYYSQSRGNGEVLAPLLERVDVLAAGEAIANDASEARRPSDARHDFSTLTILVSPEDAARVVLAQSTGTLTLLLRSRSDKGPVVVATRSSRALFAQYGYRRIGEKRPSDTVELIVGGNGSVVPDISHLNMGDAQTALPGGRT